MTETMSTDRLGDDEFGDELDELSEEQFDRMLVDLARLEVPRVFAVYEVAPGRCDVRAFGWGLEFDTRSFFLGCTEERTVYASMVSAQRVVERFGRCRDLRLLWPTADPARGFAAPWPADEEAEQLPPGT